MLDFEGKTWTRNPATLVTCEDGRTMGVAAEMSDAYILSVVQKIHDESAVQANQAANDAQAAQLAKAEPVVKYLVTHTPAEIESYVAANVTDLASARTMLRKLAVAVSVLAKRELR
jgi:hypothetical protein